MKVSAFGVDIGYSHTKSAFRTGNDISTVTFPSLAPVAPPADLEKIRQRMGDESKAALLQVHHSHYAVGHDLESLFTCRRNRRTFFDSFCLTPVYAALLGGALHFAGATEIECLVLGLPVNATSTYWTYLRDAFTGALDFGKCAINVRSVLVVPQLYGSLRSFADSGDGRFDASNEHLLIDVGFSKTNWLLYREPTSTDFAQGVVHGGAWHVYRTIGSLIADQESCPIDNMDRIGRCLQDSLPLLHNDKAIDLAHPLRKSQSVTNATIRKIRDKLASLSGLRSVVLTGGGAALYEPAVRATFPRTRIDVLDDPSQTNATGFLRIGEALVAGREILLPPPCAGRNE